MRIDVWLVVLAIPVGLMITGCGSAGVTRSPGPSRTVIETSLRGSPPELAQIHDQADALLPGGPRAFHARLRALRGHPVIVNLWASWCVPCRSEFPIFQQAAVQYGRRVAFLGIDEADQRGSATAFLRRFPVTYPSYWDPGKAIESSLLTLSATPQTFYFNDRGRMQYDHGGSYASLGALRQDIQTYLGVS